MRIFGLKAPETFGVYHFKIFYTLDDVPNYVSVPVEDYPIIVVKGELNPAYIIGTITAANRSIREGHSRWHNRRRKISQRTLLLLSAL